MPDSLQEIIDQRRAIIEPLKEELIARLDLPYRPEDIHEDVSLLGAGLGLDSLDALEIVMAVEARFATAIPDGKQEILRSINTLVDFIIDPQGGAQ